MYMSSPQQLKSIHELQSSFCPFMPWLCQTLLLPARALEKKRTESTKDHQSRESCCCRWQNSRVGWGLFICNNFPVSLLWQKYHETCKSMTDSLTKMWKNVISSRTKIKLRNILPTSEATFENIMQTHYLVAYWFEAKLKSLSSVP